MSMTKITQVIKSHDDDLKRQRVEDKVRRSATINIDFAANEYVNYDGTVASFVKKPLADMLTITRESQAVVSTPFGTETVGVDVPRFYFDPITGEARGLLCEKQRTNFFLWSEDFTQSEWTKEGSTTIDPNVIDSPLGADTGSAIVSGGLSFTVSQNTTESVSLICGGAYLKAGEITSVRVQINDSGAITNYAHYQLDLLTGVITNVISGGTFTEARPSVEKHPDGWYRASVSSGTSELQGTGYQLSLTGLDSVAGYKYYVSGAQLEVGSAPTSYIKTEANQVTRAEDGVAREIGVKIFEDGRFTVFIDNVRKLLDFTLTHSYPLFITNISGGVGSDWVGLSLSLDSIIRLRSSSGGTLASFSKNLIGSYSKVAFKFENGTGHLFVDGVYAGSGTTSVDFKALKHMRVGSSSGAAALIAGFKYIPHALTDQELQELTKP